MARNYEALIEICYTFEIKPGWSIQPDFQYIFQPGGNVAGQKDATVVGARTSISFLTKDECTHPIQSSAFAQAESSGDTVAARARSRAACRRGDFRRCSAARRRRGRRPMARTRPRRSKACSRPTTDFTKPEPGEDKPGGGATSRGTTSTANAFSLSSGNMDFKRELDFKIGNAIFRKNWISAPSSTDASDGLGPLFNSRACQNCHLKDGRGHPPFSADVPDDSGSMLVRLSVPAATEEEKDRSRRA